MAVRKPYNVNAGYVASRKYGDAYIVIYKAAEQGIDVGEDKYAIVCETHGCIAGATSVPKAREIMKCPDFCEKCMPEAFEDDPNIVAPEDRPDVVPEWQYKSFDW